MSQTIYLIGQSTTTTTFKISQSFVTTNLDYILNDLKFEFISEPDSWEHEDFDNVTSYLKSNIAYRTYNIYTAMLDNTTKSAKKLSKDNWNIIVDEYLSRSHLI